MSTFYGSLRAVRVALWDNGSDPGRELEESLSALAAAPLPAGIVRVTSRGMRPGPHLAAQAETAHGGNVVAFARPPRHPLGRIA